MVIDVVRSDTLVETLIASAEAARVRLATLLERPATELATAEVSSAMSDLHHALRTLRCERARAMVDDDGLTTAEVGRRLKVSRQVCGRLVAEGRARRAGAEEPPALE